MSGINYGGKKKELTAGAAIVGKVGIDQTTPGTTNKVVAGIDQTTPGTTNKVIAGIDQTTPGTTNKVVAELSGSILAEQLTQADAVANVLTFSENISAIEIYHDEATWQVFTINGLTITVPAGGWSRLMGGTPAATVTIPAGVSCIVGRLT